MNSLEVISQPVKAELLHYETYLRSVLGTDGELSQALLDYILSGRGKGVRPLLTMLVAKLYSQAIDTTRLMAAAMLVEMIHTASLVHDDVVDSASVRRSRASVNALWDSRSAVLIGDYILARTLAAGMESGAYDIVTYITKTVDQICQGELLQSEQCSKMTMTRQIYTDIIYRKTASLISASCVVGAMARNASREEITAIKSYGDNLGIAFQIQDDILDYTGTEGDKERYIDLTEKKITLPLLVVLENSTSEQRADLIAKLSRGTQQDIESIAQTVDERGGIAEARKIMQEYVDSALAALDAYPCTQIKESLRSLCTFIAERTK